MKRKLTLKGKKLKQLLLLLKVVLCAIIRLYVYHKSIDEAGWLTSPTVKLAILKHRDQPYCVRSKAAREIYFEISDKTSGCEFHIT